MDPNLTIAELAEKILCIARGEDESALAPLVPLPDGIDLGSGRLPQWVVDVAQVLSVVVIVVLVSIALIPSYHFGHWVQWRAKSIGSKRIDVRRDNAPWSHIKVAGTRNVYTYGLLLPFIIPLFMVSLTTIIILAKWLIIGRYRVGAARRGTPYFVRWWFVDRLIDQFSLWVGMFIYDTLFINFFYLLMGARVSPRARIKVLLREFDLISAGSHATLSGAVFARMFEPDGGMRFARVIFEPHSETKSQSVVMPGCKIEHGAVLDHGSATMAGMQLASGSLYQSNPAQLAGIANVATSSPPSTASWLWFELAKVTTLPCYLYASFFASNVFLEYTSRQVDWYAWRFRYRELAYFVLGYIAAMFVSGGVSGVVVVLLKWILIGRLHPGSSVRHDWTWRLRTWFLEWIWYRIVFGFGSLLWEETGLVSTLLMKALGMRVWFVYGNHCNYVLFLARRSGSYRDRRWHAHFYVAVLVFYDMAHFYKSDYYEDGFRVRGGRIQVWRPPVERTSALLLVGPIALMAYASMAIAYRAWQWVVLRDWKIDTYAPFYFQVAYLEYQHTTNAINRHTLALLRGSRLTNVSIRVHGFLASLWIADALVCV
ncbi:hypothetical protein CTAYLR_005401 [Chrysophaeum taylorii]|uniref:Uncharacterized protein n=1 Tax=Chrysophaeum taylorii TaxID=2483200 RepID=A0AAD7XKN9_9STRA|nr:hypothetical protein CTAYLR_005401 [Chrysophaeum taylorii]